jgi:hypothetical protein
MLRFTSTVERLSADGSTAVVAIALDRNNDDFVDAGEFQVLQFNGSDWVRQGDVFETLMGSNAMPCALSENGNVFAASTEGFVNVYDSGTIIPTDIGDDDNSSTIIPMDSGDDVTSSTLIPTDSGDDTDNTIIPTDSGDDVTSRASSKLIYMASAVTACVTVFLSF